MSIWKKIFGIWFLLIGGMIATLWLPHAEIWVSSLLTYGIQVFLFLLSMFIALKEPVKKNKAIFVNFAILFMLAFYFHAHNFIRTVLFVDEPFAELYSSQYVGFGAFYFLLAGAIVYLALDTLFREFKTYQKYLLTVSIVGAFFFYYYSPFFADPKYLYSTPDVEDWKSVENVFSAIARDEQRAPTPEEVAAHVQLHSWKDGAQTTPLSYEKNLGRVHFLFPYLEGANYQILVYKPLYMNAIYMNVLVVGFIILFFGYQYKKDPPQGAYVDKIMFMFLFFCTMEIFHAWSYIKALEWESLAEIVQLGHYVSACVLMFIALFFGLRLKFITSIKGEFYEQEIVLHPTGITRWRDSIDNLVLSQFFGARHLLGRFFAESPSLAVDAKHSGRAAK